MAFQEQAPPPYEANGFAQGEFTGYGTPEPANPSAAGNSGEPHAPDAVLPVKARRKPKQRSLNPVPAFFAVLVPWILFMVVFAATSFSLHHTSPFTCWFIVFLGALLVLAGFGVTLYTTTKRRDPIWYAFLSILMLIALVLAASLGNANYVRNLKTLYDSNSLNKYEDIDPAAYSGQQMMDAGQISFVTGVRPDPSKAMGFKDHDMYCVAPVANNSAAATAPARYDFWAAGTNCCTGAQNEFHCSEYDNKYAHSGLRVVDPEKQAFYRLAVQQAEAAYGISAPQPIFVYWLQDPNAELDACADEGMTYYLIGIFSHLAFQVVIVGLGILTIANLC